MSMLSYNYPDIVLQTKIFNSKIRGYGGTRFRNNAMGSLRIWSAVVGECRNFRARLQPSYFWLGML